MLMSLLDRTRTRVGESDAAAIAGTIDRAVHAEQLGFHRLWVAEHHAVPGIAGSAPTVLLSALGAATSTIRIGSGGVMLPNHNPFVVAEQAALLEALYPQRVDLGLGASLGFTAPIRKALGRTAIDRDGYREAIEQVRHYLHGTADITVLPRVAPPPIFLLAIRRGLALAAELGLPVVIGGPLLDDADAVAQYVRDFRPSPGVSEPHVIVSVDVAVAASAERARDLLLPEAWAMATSREVGEFRALQPIDEVKQLISGVRSEKKLAAIDNWLDSTIIGTASQVKEQLDQLATRTGAAEIMATTSTFDRAHLHTADADLIKLAGS